MWGALENVCTENWKNSSLFLIIQPSYSIRFIVYDEIVFVVPVVTDVVSALRSPEAFGGIQRALTWLPHWAAMITLGHVSSRPNKLTAHVAPEPR